MIQIITAPSVVLPAYPTVFLAGGITNCKEWQDEVIDQLKNEDISVFNPRQKHFDITDKDASYKQILWEFERLEKMDIFSMYFCNDNSDQPICMYELGRNIVKMQMRFPNDWEERIIISVEDGYRRRTDEMIQVGLCAPNLFVEFNGNPNTHAQYIKKALRKIR